MSVERERARLAKYLLVVLGISVLLFGAAVAVLSTVAPQDCPCECDK